MFGDVSERGPSFIALDQEIFHHESATARNGERGVDRPANMPLLVVSFLRVFVVKKIARTSSIVTNWKLAGCGWRWPNVGGSDGVLLSFAGRPR
jgi:hypothetical protein